MVKIKEVYKDIAYSQAILKKHDRVECKIVHTGQHDDYEMLQAFFEDMESALYLATPVEYL